MSYTASYTYFHKDTGMGRYIILLFEASVVPDDNGAVHVIPGSFYHLVLEAYDKDTGMPIFKQQNIIRDPGWFFLKDVLVLDMNYVAAVVANWANISDSNRRMLLLHELRMMFKGLKVV
jgi:hypothetical protein